MNKFTSELGKTVRLPVDSDEYKKIFYSLTLNLSMPSAEINVKEISAIPTSFVAFNKSENESSVILESWVNRDSLKESQTLENVINNSSFDITPERPMKFIIGTLLEDNEIMPNQEYCFVFCKIKGKQSLIYLL